MAERLGCKGLVETIRHAKAGGEPKLGATPLDVDDRQGLLESSNRF